MNTRMPRSKRHRLQARVRAGLPTGLWPWRRLGRGRGLLKPLVTQRAVLRLPSFRDASVFAREAGNPLIAQWMLNFPSPFPQQMARQRIAQSWQNFLAGQSVSLIGIHRHTGAFLGGVALNNICALPEPELAYWIAQDHWQQGYAQELTSALIDYAFTVRGDHRLRASVLGGNSASVALLQRLGFVPDGVEMVWAEPYAPTVGLTMEELSAHHAHTGSALVSVSLNKWLLYREAWDQRRALDR